MIQLYSFSLVANAQINNDDARQLLEKILNTAEFAHAREGISISEYLSHLLLRVLSYINLDRVNDVLIIAIVVAGILLTFWLVRLTAPFLKGMSSNVESIAVTEAATVRPSPPSLLQEAEKKASAGHFRLALRDLYLSLLFEMDNRRVISYRPAKTNHEYLAEIRSNAATLEARFKSMVNLFDYKWYGLEHCNMEDFQKGRDLYFSLIREASHD
ncbi:DUF4129 domain-containing protein [Dethiobacter alkaliphilus]|uniref:Protein-glutamine gamma-glutamyltransferase-like C-terminal domain-containing protein n=1 Tax=Dethiobacter alkaliphilus AHT 1 TaxID=555088 RepID=C0GFK5_DETAL|nr:DUF4129 domain-containing protein [Dethiobacter alkaliphilus]EEG77965.1 hypothetical protein DealDRAFT_1264 [Dethiobacter alkaliphilus AHT 1]